MVAIVITVCVVMVGATWVALAKPGQSDELTNYGRKDEEQ